MKNWCRDDRRYRGALVIPPCSLGNLVATIAEARKAVDVPGD
jgi:hypothetical protein